MFAWECERSLHRWFFFWVDGPDGQAMQPAPAGGQKRPGVARVPAAPRACGLWKRGLLCLGLLVPLLPVTRAYDAGYEHTFTFHSWYICKLARSPSSPSLSISPSPDITSPSQEMTSKY